MCVLHDGKDAGLYVVVVVVEYARRRRCHLSPVMMQLLMERKEGRLRAFPL